MDFAPSLRRPSSLFPWVALCLGLLVFHCGGNATRGYIDTSSLFVWWGKQWFTDGAETEHGPLVLLLSVWFFRRAWRESAETTSRRETTAGWCLMTGGLGLHLVGLISQQTRLSIVAFLLFLWGWSWLAFGARAGRAAVFPLVLMCFSIPLEFLTDEVSPKLRLMVTVSTETISNWLHLDVVRNGSQLYSADGSFHYDVAPACSGIRSLVALLVLSLVIGRLSFPGWKRTALLGLLALPFAFLGNVARLLGIVLVGRWFGQKAGMDFHDYSGFLVFLIVLGLALLTARIIRKCQPSPPEPTSPQPTVPAVPRPRATWAWTTLLLALGTTGGLSAWVIRLAPSPLAGIRLDAEGNPVKLPDYLVTLSGQNLEPTVEKEVLPPDTRFSYKIYRSLRDPNDMLQIMIVLSGADRSSLHKPEICLPGQGWSTPPGEVRHISLPEMSSGDLPVTTLRISRKNRLPDGSEQEARALFTYWFVGSEDVVASHWERQWLTATNRLFHLKFDRWAYVAVLAPVTKPGQTGEDAAWQRTQDFARRAVPQFQTAGLKK